MCRLSTPGVKNGHFPDTDYNSTGRPAGPVPQRQIAVIAYLCNIKNLIKTLSYFYFISHVYQIFIAILVLGASKCAIVDIQGTHTGTEGKREFTGPLCCIMHSNTSHEIWKKYLRNLPLIVDSKTTPSHNEHSVKSKSNGLQTFCILFLSNSSVTETKLQSLRWHRFTGN